MAENALLMIHAPVSYTHLDVYKRQAGLGIDSDKTGASMTLGSPGVMHGFYSYLLQDDAGNPLEAYSISAGLDYPGVGPEHAYFKDEGIVRYLPVTDADTTTAATTRREQRSRERDASPVARISPHAIAPAPSAPRAHMNPTTQPPRSLPLTPAAVRGGANVMQPDRPVLLIRSQKVPLPPRLHLPPARGCAVCWMRAYEWR